MMEFGFTVGSAAKLDSSRFLLVMDLTLIAFRRPGLDYAENGIEM